MPGYIDSESLSKNIMENFPRDPVFDAVVVLYSFIRGRHDLAPGLPELSMELPGNPVTMSFEHEMVSPATEIHAILKARQHWSATFLQYNGYLEGQARMFTSFHFLLFLRSAAFYPVAIDIVFLVPTYLNYVIAIDVST